MVLKKETKWKPTPEVRPYSLGHAPHVLLTKGKAKGKTQMGASAFGGYPFLVLFKANKEINHLGGSLKDTN